MGHIYFPTVLDGKELLCPTARNRIMSITARHGASDVSPGHFSRGSIKLKSLPVSPWVLAWGILLCHLEHGALYRQLLWSILFHCPGWQRDPWSQGALKMTFFCHPLIHSHSFRVPPQASLSYSQQHATWRGENYSCEKEICFLELSSTWELFENNNAGNSLFWFCIQWTGKSLAVFLHTVHLDEENF